MSTEKKTRQQSLQEKLNSIKTSTDKNGERKSLEAVEQEIWKLHSDILKKKGKYISQRDTAIKMLADIDVDLEQILRYVTNLKSVASKQAQPANTSSAS